jgi:S-formylglutathione hydrolase
MKPDKRFFTSSLLVLILLISVACRISLAQSTPTYYATHTPAASASQSLAQVSPTGGFPEPPTFTAAPADTPTPSIQIEVQQGKITSQALAGNLLGDPKTRDYYVLLPPGYADSGKRYPVVYFLHQFGGLAGTYVPVMKEVYARLLSTGEVKEMIIVFPDGSNKLGGSWYLSSPTIGDYETYLTKEFVDLIDKQYRTIPDRDSRGITGCSMGGIGALRLAFKYPDVFSVAAGVSGYYDKSQDPFLSEGVTKFKAPLKDFVGFDNLPRSIRIEMAEAAGAAPNPNAPPFYMDMPFQVVNDETQIVDSVIQKEKALDPLRAAMNYLKQPLRLRGLMIYHGIQDPLIPVETARLFDKQLNRLGLPHDYLEVEGQHCDLDFGPVLKFESGALITEMAATPMP